MTTRFIAGKNTPAVERLCGLMLYIVAACRQRPSFDAPALAGALYLCDFAAYDRLGRSITGCAYVKGPHGPVPVGLDEAFDALLAGRVDVETGLDGARLVPATDVDVSMFTAPEISLIDEVVGRLDASAASEWSYGAGWNAVRYGQEIPYCFAGVSDDELSAADLERAREIAALGVHSHSG